MLHGGVDVEPSNMDTAKAAYLDKQEKQEGSSRGSGCGERECRRSSGRTNVDDPISGRFCTQAMSLQRNSGHDEEELSMTLFILKSQTTLDPLIAQKVSDGWRVTKQLKTSTRLERTSH